MTVGFVVNFSARKAEIIKAQAAAHGISYSDVITGALQKGAFAEPLADDQIKVAEEDARRLYFRIMERLCRWKNWFYRTPAEQHLPLDLKGNPEDAIVRIQQPVATRLSLPDGQIEDLRQNNLLAWVSDLTGARTAVFLRRTLDRHIDARRIDWMEHAHRNYGSCYRIYYGSIVEYLKLKNGKAA